MAHLKYDSRGFTLVETVITIAIFVAILSALLILYDNYTKIYNSQQGMARTAGAASAAANELQSLFLQADHILTSHTFSDGVTRSSNNNTLALEIPAVDGAGNVISGKYDYAAFYVNGSKFYRLIDVDPSSSRHPGLKQLSDTLSSFELTYDNADLTTATKINVEMSMQTTVGHQTYSYSLQQSLYLRN